MSIDYSHFEVCAVPMSTIQASLFKAKCLALLDQVAETKESIVITKRGKPVAKLTPIDTGEPIMGSVTFATKEEQDVFSTGEAWDVEV